MRRGDRVEEGSRTGLGTGLQVLSMLVLMLLIFATGVGAQKEEKGGLDKTLNKVGEALDTLRGKDTAPTSMDEALTKNIADWPAGPKRAVQKMVAKYGPPDEFTPHMVMWHNKDMTKPLMGSWKHIHIHRDPVAHSFPKPHEDYLEQVINYKVPAARVSDLAAFDGSLVVCRTGGELKAVCDEEANNILALNLAHDVIIGKRTAADARRALADTAAAVGRGETPDLTQRLMFEVPKTGTGDADKPMMGREEQSKVPANIGPLNTIKTTKPPKKSNQ